MDCPSGTEILISLQILISGWGVLMNGKCFGVLTLGGVWEGKGPSLLVISRTYTTDMVSRNPQKLGVRIDVKDACEVRPSPSEFFRGTRNILLDQSKGVRA